jgi:hypothetical protein
MIRWSSANNRWEKYNGATWGVLSAILAVATLDVSTAITTPSATVALLNTVATTVNAFGAATAINIGASTGTLTIANATLAAKAGTFSGALSASNLSGTNTGDNAVNSLYSGLVTMTYPGAGIPLSTGSAWGTSIANASANWNTAYTERHQWDGGATNLVAATGRTSLGLGSAAQSASTDFLAVGGTAQNSTLLQGGSWAQPNPIGSSIPPTIAATTISASGVITSTLATGTAPLTVASTTQVTNLNASYVGGTALSGLWTPSQLPYTASQSWTPTLSAATGTFTTASATGQYTIIGDRTLWSVVITITTNGTAAGNVRFTLPSTPANISVGAGREDVVNGNAVIGVAPASSNVMLVVSYNNAYPGVNGAVLKLSGHYK